MAALASDPLPVGLFADVDALIVQYARVSTATLTIDDDLYQRLSRHLSPRRLVHLWGAVAAANVINRFHATFHTDLDESTVRTAEAGDRKAGSCPIPWPAAPPPTSPG